MMRTLVHKLSVLPWLACLSCADTGRAEISLPVFAQGTAAREIRIEGARIRLTEAEVAFGPLYLCATASAESELCETALAELLSTQTCDALSTKKTPWPELAGTTGKVQSGFFDYGITWGLTQQMASHNQGSARGHSARLRGEIDLDQGPSFEFYADIDIEPLAPGDAAVNGLRTRHALSQQTQSLVVRFDPNAWLKRIKLDGLLALEPDQDGKVSFEPGSQPYEAIVQAMTANAPPTLEWEDE